MRSAKDYPNFFLENSYKETQHLLSRRCATKLTKTKHYLVKDPVGWNPNLAMMENVRRSKLGRFVRSECKPPDMRQKTSTESPAG